MSIFIISVNEHNFFNVVNLHHIPFFEQARRVGSDGSMSASGSAGPGFNPRRGSKF